MSINRVAPNKRPTLIALAFALKVSVEFSRVWAFSSWIVGVSLIFFGRLATYYFIRTWAESGHLSRNIVVLGAGEQAHRLIEALEHNNEPWNFVVGVFDDRASRRHADIPEHAMLGTFDDMLAFVRTHRVDDVVIALPWSAEQRFFEYCNKLREVPVHVRIAPDLVAFHFRNKEFSALGGMATFDVVPKPLAGWQYVVKEVEDRLFAILLTIGLLPLMLGIAVAIKLGSPGPVLFRQKRYGYNNKVFSVFKFRTMYHDAPGCTDDNVKQAQRNDPRVTPIGKLLRMTSLDELPQLLNVLGGTMSLVGPRPHAVPHNEQYAKIISDYFARHRTKPGITGWAQVNGLRGETDTPEKMKARVEHDIYYIENWSLLFDIKILLKTVYVVATFKNAY